MPGINYGHYFQNNAYNASKATRDLKYLKNFYSAVRVMYNWYSAVDTPKAIALLAKSLGFRVVVGITCPSDATQSQWEQFMLDVVEFAQWCHDNSIDQMSVGNEEDWHNASGEVGDTVVRSDQRALATTIKSLYPDLLLSVEIAEANLEAWIEEGRGDIDMVGLNLYNTLTGIPKRMGKLKAAFSTEHCYISEWGGAAAFPDLDMSEIDYATEMKARRALYDTSGLEHFLFTFQWNDTWDLKRASGGKFRTAWWAIIGHQNVYWTISGGNMSTARTKGNTDSPFPNENRHDGASVIQADWSLEDLDYFNSQSWATYYGECVNGICIRDGV